MHVAMAFNKVQIHHRFLFTLITPGDFVKGRSDYVNFDFGMLAVMLG